MSRALLVVDEQGGYAGGALPLAWPPLEVSLPHIRPVAPAVATGSPGRRLLEETDGVVGDLAVEKALPSAFAGTESQEWEQALDSGLDPAPTGLPPSAAAAPETSGMS